VCPAEITGRVVGVRKGQARVGGVQRSVGAVISGRLLYFRVRSCVVIPGRKKCEGGRTETCEAVMLAGVGVGMGMGRRKGAEGESRYES